MLILASTTVAAAKPPLDANAYATWPAVDGATISDDGKYAAYTVSLGGVPAQRVIVSTDARWRLELPATSSADFICTSSGSCRFVIFRNMDGELGIVTLGSGAVEYAGRVDSYQTPAAGAGRWLAYRQADNEKLLVVRDLRSGAERRYADVREYSFDAAGSVLLLRVAKSTDAERLEWIELSSGQVTSIWEGRGLGTFVFDATGRRLAFVVQPSGKEGGQREFWYYTAAAPRAYLLADQQTVGIDPGQQLNEIRNFSADGRSLSIDLTAIEPRLIANPDAVALDVWSYRDETLQSQQLASLAAATPPVNHAAVLDLQSRTVRQLERSNEKLVDRKFNPQLGEVGLMERRSGGADITEWHWSSAGRLAGDIVFLQEGRRVALPAESIVAGTLPQLSPGGRFVVYFDAAKQTFMSREIVTGKVRDIAANSSTVWERFDVQWLSPNWPRTRGIAAWLQDEAGVLVYDRYDVWRLDLVGVRPPVNLTNGYGRRHQTIFSLPDAKFAHDRTVAANADLVLSAVDTVSKGTGFFAKNIGSRGDPKLLTMGPYVYSSSAEGSAAPIKARHAQQYVVRRESSTESPNFFSTRDFKTFTRLSDLHPQRNYNWLRPQLVTWQRDGLSAQGILYTPENFDPAKKYPVILTYYELASSGLNGYLSPGALTGGCEINVPLYVSRGYLVFKPDIYYEVGEIRASAVRAVVSAAERLRAMPWVDPAKMGIQGCSFGGMATHSVVTSTGLFAAAVSASAVADLISASSGLFAPSAGMRTLGGASLQGMYETGQPRMGASLGERPDLYVRNSAILHAGSVSTPLLIMHTRDDSISPLANAIEFFTTLRRLGKTAWLLQYNEGDHQLSGKSAADFGTRMAQFFDHYLRGAAAPKWMTQGVPARLKGVETGLELGGPSEGPRPGLYDMQAEQPLLYETTVNP